MSDHGSGGHDARPSNPKHPKPHQKIFRIISNFTKGFAAFELLPDRRFGIMRRMTATHSHWWEIHDLYIGRRLTAFKTLESHSGSLDTYALPLTCVIDASRLAWAVYQDEGVGSQVLKTGGSIAGGWAGGYFGALGGYKTGEYLGNLVGKTESGILAVVLGYFGGVVGAQYGDRLARTLLLQNDN